VLTILKERVGKGMTDMQLDDRKIKIMQAISAIIWKPGNRWEAEPFPNIQI